jgi:putative ABC transport system permease protein
MNLYQIALRSITQRSVASTLTVISMALGVMLVVAVLTIHGVLEQSFRNNASLGFNMLVGSKGGKEQLVLNSVFYLSSPIENISYDYYLEFKTREERRKELQNSLRIRGHDQLAETAELAAFAGGTGVERFALEAALEAEKQINVRWQDLDRHGRHGQQVDFAIPLCLGDYYGRFRVVGTTPQLFDDFVFDLDNNRKYEFAQGRNFQHRSMEHGYFEAVVGATVAREMDVTVGMEISPAHGSAEGHLHERKFTVVGILKPSGTPNDRAVFVNMEGFFLMEDHAKPVNDARTAERPQDEPKEQLTEEEEKKRWLESRRQKQLLERELDPLPLATEQREVTAILIRVDPRQALPLESAVNKGKEAQAVGPFAVIYNMFEFIVRPIQTTLLVLTWAICIVSGISILVSIYNSMNDRRHEIAVMRSLGADRWTVSRIILYEAMLLSLGGCFLGWFLGHLGCLIASPSIVELTGVPIGFHAWGEPFIHPLEWFSISYANQNEALNNLIRFPTEWLIVPALMLLAVIVGIWPAISAYRTDVSKSLGK